MFRKVLLILNISHTFSLSLLSHWRFTITALHLFYKSLTAFLSDNVFCLGIS